jgi:hypothetical protein
VLIAFDDEQALAGGDDVVGVVLLGVRGVGGDHRVG